MIVNVPSAMGVLKLVPKEREWSVAITSFLLCAVSLLAAHRARKVNLGSAMGFLMQACVGALGTVHSCTAAPARLLTSGQREARWLATVVGLPLISFGFHWLNEDRLAANSVLTGGILAAACCGHLAEESRATAARAALAAPLLSVLAACIFTANLCGVAGCMAVCLAGEATELLPGGLPGLKLADVQNLLLSSGVLALQRALDTQHRAVAA
uniref:transmembrane protein 276-like n=1 Tax=Pristiophorus japonicus TaxID=55135 RepID=UPI00398F7851